jgi:hypothetical protein
MQSLINNLNLRWKWVSYPQTEMYGHKLLTSTNAALHFVYNMPSQSEDA